MLWRVERLVLQNTIKSVIIHCGTNNITKNRYDEIADSIICIALILKAKQPSLKVILTGIFPRDSTFSKYREIIPKINNHLKLLSSNYDFMTYLEPDHEWLLKNGCLRDRLQNSLH